jgi:hypothetical protein
MVSRGPNRTTIDVDKSTPKLLHKLRKEPHFGENDSHDTIINKLMQYYYDNNNNNNNNKQQ